jgi:hypothetical protein
MRVDGHFREEGVLKAMLDHLCRLNHTKIGTPFNLQIIPYLNTEIAIEKEIVSILMRFC